MEFRFDSFVSHVAAPGRHLPLLLVLNSLGNFQKYHMHAYAILSNFFLIFCLPFVVAKKVVSTTRKCPFLCFSLILCHVKKAYLPHKKQESAFLMWHRNIKSKKMPLWKLSWLRVITKLISHFYSLREYDGRKWKDSINFSQKWSYLNFHKFTYWLLFKFR